MFTQGTFWTTSIYCHPSEYLFEHQPVCIVDITKSRWYDLHSSIFSSSLYSYLSCYFKTVFLLHMNENWKYSYLHKFSENYPHQIFRPSDGTFQIQKRIISVETIWEIRYLVFQTTNLCILHYIWIIRECILDHVTL